MRAFNQDLEMAIRALLLLAILGATAAGAAALAAASPAADVPVPASRSHAQLAAASVQIVCRTQFQPAGEHVFGVPLRGARLSWRTTGTPPGLRRTRRPAYAGPCGWPLGSSYQIAPRSGALTGKSSGTVCVCVRVCCVRVVCVVTQCVCVRVRA